MLGGMGFVHFCFLLLRQWCGRGDPGRKRVHAERLEDDGSIYGFRYEVFERCRACGSARLLKRWQTKLACFGWVQNTYRGTVAGEARSNSADGPGI